MCQSLCSRTVQVSPSSFELKVILSELGEMLLETVDTSSGDQDGRSEGGRAALIFRDASTISRSVWLLCCSNGRTRSKTPTLVTEMEEESGPLCQNMGLDGVTEGG